MTLLIRSPQRKFHALSGVSPAILGEDFGPTGVEVDGTFYKNVRVIEAEGHVYVVSHKAILTISMTPVCNASCTFCFNGITFFPGDKALDPSHPNVSRTIDFARNGGVKNVSFSGGEPTLVPERLLAMTALVEPHFPCFRRLHTNGSRLWSEVTHRGRRQPLWRHLLDRGLNEISISRAAMDPVANARIMRMPQSGSMSRTDLQRLAAEFPLVRLSCFVHPNGVASPLDAIDYVAAGMAFGVRSFVFRVSSRYPQTQVLPSEFSVGNSLLPLKTDEFRRTFERFGFDVIFSRHDVDSDLFILRRDRVTVSVDSSADVPDPDRKIRRLLLMPNGVCYTSWVEAASVLFPGDHRELVEQSRKEMVLGERFPAHSVRRVYVRRPDPVEVDLHMHSTLSDGHLSPSEVIDRQHRAGAKAIVLTEHNALHPRFEELREYARGRGIEIPFPGMEVSCQYRSPDGRQSYRFHMLLFGEGLLEPSFQRWIAKANRAENQYYNELHRRLRERGMELPDLEEIYALGELEESLRTERAQRLRTPLAAAVARCVGIPEAEAKERFVPKVPAAQKQMDSLDAVDVIRWADALNCVCVLAHPGWVRDTSDERCGSFDGVLEVILALHTIGLGGLEIFHRANDAEAVKRLTNLAFATDMILTGGSDFHGRSGDRLGVDGTSWENLERIQASLEWKRRRSFAAQTAAKRRASGSVGAPAL